MARGETERHRRLKVLALGWAQAHGFPVAGLEVRVPGCGYRADVAARGRGPEGLTALFECKQARGDLRKDYHDLVTTRERLEQLERRRMELEALLEVHCPTLRRGDSLFPQFEAWDFSALEHRAYRELLTELGTLQERLRFGTKFARLFRYRCADLLYLVAEEDLLAPAEWPAGWGVLVRCGEELVLERPPVLQAATAQQRQGLTEAIALAGTRAWNRLTGVTPPAWPARPVKG